MAISSIQNKEFFAVKDEDDRTIFYGFDQRWYTSEWQRRAGCGPTVAANIVNYLNCTCRGGSQLPLTKQEALALMEEVYQYVTPTPRGIPSTKLLHDKLLDYAQGMGLKMEVEVLNIPEDQGLRPSFSELIAFLDKALRNNIPLAFLNLDNGAEKRLDAWHWVTVISLDTLSGDSALINILDGGTVQEIDLAQWFRTTRLGGGFISFGRILTT